MITWLLPPPADYFFHKDGTSNGGNRYATVLMYLSDVEEGGETVSRLPFAARRACWLGLRGRVGQVANRAYVASLRMSCI